MFDNPSYVVIRLECAGRAVVQIESSARLDHIPPSQAVVRCDERESPRGYQVGGQSRHKVGWCSSKLLGGRTSRLSGVTVELTEDTCVT
jgi:hypothetical protein